MAYHPHRTGIAQTTTIGLFYALCSLGRVLAPDPSLSFMNGLLHGMDFSGMVQPGPFGLSGFLRESTSF